MDHYFFEALVKAIPVAVIAVDENLTVRAVSSSAEELLDIRAVDAVGCHIKDCSLLGEAGLLNLANTLEGGAVQNHTCFLYGERGRKTEVKLRTQRIEDANGKIMGAVLIMDTSELDNHTQKVINKEKIELAEQMAIGIAHHIRNPLTSVRGFIQIVQDKSNSEPVTGFLEFSNIALKEMDRVNDVISNLLQLADSSATKREVVNVGSLLENVFAFIKGRAVLSGVLLKKEMSPSLPNTSINLVQVIHALFNILDNAIQSMPDGGQLSLKAYPVPEKNRVCIEIGDTGIGIPEENLNKIFNPFYSTKGEGMGFGLALTNKIIYEHRGEIKVISEIRKGTTFFVYLPIYS